MRLSIERDIQGRMNSVHYETERRYAWVGLTGMGFGDALEVHNSHWYDLRHPWQRYSAGPTRFAHFWTSLWWGFSRFVSGSRNPDE